MQEKVEALNERLEKETYIADKPSDFIDLESTSSKTNFTKVKGKSILLFAAFAQNQHLL